MTRHTAHAPQIPQPPADHEEALLEAIAHLGNPIADILAALDAATFLQLLQRIRNRDRVQMLQALRVPSARLSPRAAEQCLTTLRIRKSDMQNLAASTISQPTRKALADAIHAHEYHGDGQPLADAVAGFSEARPELMLAAFAMPLASPGHTAMLRHALHRFPMPAWPKDDVQTAIDTCAALESAWLPLMPSSQESHGDSAAPPPDQSPSPAEIPQLTSAQPAAANPTADWSSRADDLDDLLTSARAAAARITAHLEDSHVPSLEDLAAVTALQVAALRLHQDLAAQAAAITPTDLAALGNAAREAAAEGSKRARDRALLLRAASLQGPSGSAPLESVREQALTLLDAPSPDTGHLGLLVALADATTSDDDKAIDDLLARLKDAPQDINSVTALILRGKVTAPAAPTSGSSVSRTGPPASADAAPSRPRPTAAADTTQAEDVRPVAPSPATEKSAPPATAPLACPPLSAPKPDAGTPASEPSVHTRMATAALADKEPAVAEPSSPVPAVTPKSVPTGAALITRLINQGDLALAGHAAYAANQPALQQALHTLQLAHSVRSETGPCASALRDRIDQEIDRPSTTNQDERMLLLAAALRAALLTADPNAGELVNALTDSCPTMAHLQQLCSAIGTASARGQLTAAGGLNVLDTVAEADAEASRAAEDAGRHRTAPRHLHFPRAETIVRAWWDTDGLIGTLLSTAADDQRGRADQVAARLRELTPNALGKNLKDMDNRLRKGGAVLQGAARRRILQYATESLDIVNTWLLATRAAARGPALSSVLVKLRDEVRAEAEGAFTELHALAETTEQPITSAIAQATLDSIRTTTHLLNGGILHRAEPAPNYALNSDLLRCARLPLTKTLDPTRAVTLDDVMYAQSHTWAQAAREQAEAGNFAAARIAVEVAEGESGEDDTTLRDAVEQARGHALTTTRALIDDVRSTVATATRQGRLPEPGRSDVTAQVEAAEAELANDDFSAVTCQLQSVTKLLPELADLAKADLTQRARDEINNAPGGAPGDVMTKITQLVDTGDLATAEDYLLTALAGEHPPTSAPEDDLERFFPAVPDRLPEGITAALIEAVSNGGTHAGLDFSQLRARERNTTTEVLRFWSSLLKNWHANKNNAHLLRGALRIAGIEYGSEQATDISYAPNRRWIELVDVQLLGASRLPTFGTEADGRLRVLLTTDVSDVTTLLAWAAQDTSALPVLIVLLGTLPAASRRELAVQTAKHANKPLLCLDAAALSYLASRASNRFTTTERVLAPFAAANPYRPDANEAVPREMFYGRQQELNDITSMTGAQLLYGGRQLGKSALLRAAARRFETTRGHVALYIPLPTTLGLGQGTDELWDMIGRELDRKNITPAQQRRHGTAHDRVTSAITVWLDGAPTRRLLVLFDECDIFFDAEAQHNFPQTTRLRELMSTTNRKFKPVFAGLHQVQRFSGLPNQPLYDAHFGKPVVIGPLAPAPAFRLIQQPLEALGIRLPDELIHRILAYCNYHPKLLQLAGQALVQTSLNARTSTPATPSTPPWIIDNAALERVIGSQDLTERTRNTINLTLELDPRYKLIALIVALEAHARGVDRRIPTRELSRACDDWWPQGFTGQGPDEFRALLEEMTGLGILAGAPNGWRLRSSNVLRLLGNQQAIEEALENHDRSKPLTKLTAAQARRPISADNRISPLTEQQLARLTTPGNELRIVIGSAATGLDAVAAVLEDQQNRAPSKLEPIVSSASPAHYKKLLSTGKPGPMHRIVVMDLRGFSDAAARGSLEQAVTIQPPSGVTRTVVALADARDPEHLALAADFDPDNVLVPLRRATREGVSSWVADVESLAAFAESKARNRLLDVTGGWPLLLDEALKRVLRGQRVPALCKGIEEEIGSGTLGANLLNGLGLVEATDLRDLLTDLAAFDEPLPWDDVAELLQESHAAPEGALNRLRTLDVLVQDEEQRYLLDPVVRRAWSRHKKE
ncbi:hypothetical protein [Streptomyces mirabilis]|uniref:hypothetical protein n=1 Tax=Streptomyces mirabilis TaxID=68239 RepID=UPI003699BAAC